MTLGDLRQAREVDLVVVLDRADDPTDRLFDFPILDRRDPTLEG